MIDYSIWKTEIKSKIVYKFSYKLTFIFPHNEIPRK